MELTKNSTWLQMMNATIRFKNEPELTSETLGSFFLCQSQVYTAFVNLFARMYRHHRHATRTNPKTASALPDIENLCKKLDKLQSKIDEGFSSNDDQAIAELRDLLKIVQEHNAEQISNFVVAGQSPIYTLRLFSLAFFPSKPDALSSEEKSPEIVITSIKMNSPLTTGVQAISLALIFTVFVGGGKFKVGIDGIEAEMPGLAKSCQLMKEALFPEKDEDFYQHLEEAMGKKLRDNIIK